MQSGEGITIREKYFRLPRENVALFKFLLEGYEGLVSVTTVDAHAALVKISFVSACTVEVDEIICALQREFLLTNVKPEDAIVFGTKEA